MVTAKLPCSTATAQQQCPSMAYPLSMRLVSPSIIWSSSIPLLCSGLRLLLKLQVSLTEKKCRLSSSGISSLRTNGRKWWPWGTPSSSTGSPTRSWLRARWSLASPPNNKKASSRGPHGSELPYLKKLSRNLSSQSKRKKLKRRPKGKICLRLKRASPSLKR